MSPTTQGAPALTITRIQSRLKALSASYQALYDDSQAEFEKAVAVRDDYRRGIYRGRAFTAWMILCDLGGLSADIEQSEGGAA